ICLILASAVGQTNYKFQQPVDEESYYPNPIFSDTFDWKILKEFASKYRNVVISPISVKLVLALLYQGSGGFTERQFQDVLQFANKKTVDEDYRRIISTLQASERSEYLLNMGTCIFLDSDLQPNTTFQKKASQIYKTEIRPTGFKHKENATNSINSWVEKLTNGKVSHLVSPGDLEQTVMMIANAVYFKGTWQHQFPKSNTRYGAFFVSAEDPKHMKTVSIPYMSTTDQFFIKESMALDAKILRLPYKGSAYSMFIILPNSLGGLKMLLKKINLNNLTELLYALEKRLVEVNIPKFKFSFKAQMGATLHDFGVSEIFKGTANLTGIIRDTNRPRLPLAVSDIIQMSGIELDEEGSVVYSATDVNIGNKFGEPKDVFNATHPFLFFIEGPNGTVLFNGKIENPAEEGEQLLPNRSSDLVQSEPVDAQAHNSFQYYDSSSQNAVSFSRPEYTEPPRVPSIQPERPIQAPNLEPNLYETTIQTNKEELFYRFNLFDAELLSTFSDSDVNVFISPASIKTTLAMILEGAGGKSASEISEVLRIPNINQKGIREILMALLNIFRDNSGSSYLQNSNAIFASDKYKTVDRYRNIIEGFYRGEVKSVNFRNTVNAVATINNWVTDATHGALREIVGPNSISSETSVVIANALFFKGKWKTLFDPDDTKEKCFHTPTGCVMTPMMRLSSTFNYSYITRLRTHAIEIPYEDDFSMLILLPSEDVSIRSVVRDLPHFKIADILEALKSSDIILQIPKFQFEYSTDLIEYLKQLRIREVFGTRANLSGIIESGNMLINTLVHKTRVEVDEQGTVAAAATGAIVIPLIGSTTVIVNRPFAFYIYHQPTTSIIFEGILLNPQEQSAKEATKSSVRNSAANSNTRRHFK
ncbi:hypothetical protein NQ318_021153, partial [Aromia moschata]